MSEKRDVGNSDFWSVDDLTPPMGKKKNTTAKKEEKTSPPKLQDTLPKSTQPTFQYTTSVHPQRGGLLFTSARPGQLTEEIRISTWPTPYNFFEQFRFDALRFFDVDFGEEEFEPFFSFMPQYFQLGGKQLRYYLWWRANFRKGIILRPDYSYLLLFIYEVLNLPEKIPPKQGATQLAILWACCRKEYPRLDKYLCDWLADYCMIHNIPLPTEYLMPFYGDILKQTSVREYYIDALDTEQNGGKKAYYRAILEMSCTYRFRESKAITPQNKKQFEQHIPAAVTELLAKLLQNEEKKDVAEAKRVSRDSYAGAVCSYSEKRMIDMTVHPITLHSELTHIVTDAVRYSENCLRRGLKLRAGFQTPHLTEAMKSVIDGYFVRHFPTLTLEKRVQERTMDEKYEGKRGFSDSEALAIEASSRSVAKRLGAVYDEEETAITPTVPDTGAETSKNDIPREELKALLAGGYKALCDLAASRGQLIETLVEKVNSYTTELYGDIFLELDGDGYRVIEDYIEEIGDLEENA